ncbi:MAG TPA: DotU family type IV/VI secretion system protein [Dyella sp.]|nr:DotU family type IV/VI secretion system protein [Dyella sp.]
MADPSRSFLLGCFAGFYEEVARIKLAAHSGGLVRLLQPDAPHEQIEPHDLAERVAKRLIDVLEGQQRMVAAATPAEQKAYRDTRYVMVALADEIFILNLQWPAANHWPEHLLEYTFYRTRIAGRQFFTYVQNLIDSRDRSQLDADFAAVLLLSMQLGFQGMYRGGKDGRDALRALRGKLYPIANQTQRAGNTHMFPQAYEYTVVSNHDNTRVALAPWLRAVAYGSLVYLLVSSIVWLVLTWSLLRVIKEAM